jgi:hypothetical protein
MISPLPVTADLTLYAKLGTQRHLAYEFDRRLQIPDANIRGTEGAASLLRLCRLGPGSNAWDNQVNFLPIPVGEAGKNYKITFSYKINGAGGDVKICDIDQRLCHALAPRSPSAFVSRLGNRFELPFSGASPSRPTPKLTFELGKIAASVTERASKSPTFA